MSMEGPHNVCVPVTICYGQTCGKNQVHKVSIVVMNAKTKFHHNRIKSANKNDLKLF